MKTLALILVICSQLCGCLPLLAGGAIGYGISQSQNDHSRWLERERIRRHNERWAWEMYHRGDISHREYQRLMRDGAR